MMKKILYLIIMCLSLSAYAQVNDKEAELLLDKVQKKIESFGTFKALFSINGENSAITVKGNKFKMESPGITIWYNGDEQWTYIKDSQEVNLTNPDNSELNAINPYHFLKNWHNSCSCKYIGEMNIKGQSRKAVELKNRNISDFDNIVIFISPTNEISTMAIKDANGDPYSIEIKKIEKNLSIDDTQFNFNERQYPDAEIIDLR